MFSDLIQTFFSVFEKFGFGLTYSLLIFDGLRYSATIEFYLLYFIVFYLLWVTLRELTLITLNLESV